MKSSIEGKRVLITGAGGSIGAALAHAVAQRSPASLLLLDAAELALYNIDRKLNPPHTAALGSTRDSVLLADLFQRFDPQIVFHAAAFKHASMLEHNPFAAIDNNVTGTRLLLESALRYGAERFILVSTDKAVDPHSIMGASKRLAELLLLAHSSQMPTRVSAVRLVNVWGSSGSVIELFAEQLAAGGPLTVTDPAATRFFMTIDAAVAAILAALDLPREATILVPAVVSPQSIVQIARTMIDAAASEATVLFTGSRPGDKPSEQLLSAAETMLPAEGDRPLRGIVSPAPSAGAILEGIAAIEAASARRDLSSLLAAITGLVPEYTISSVIRAARNQTTLLPKDHA